jgi:hypothetical protein
MGFLLSLLGGPIVNAVMGVFNKIQDRKLSEAEARAEVEKAVMGTISEVSKSQADVIIAETKSDSWLARNWRPIVALSSFGSIWFVIFAYPFLLTWGLLPQVRFGDVGLEWFFTLTTICVGGYVGGRSVEKITDMVTRRR